jgi:uncharacterized protein (DUF58 family)
VRTTLAIHAHRKARGLLDGAYTSLFHGRSLEFDDVRPYIPGDEVKDVDWKATARLGSLMSRRYIATRKHTIVLVVDTGRSMAAVAESGELKRDIAVLAAGTAGFIAAKNGDLVALVSGDESSTRYLAPESTDAHLERVLHAIFESTRPDGGHGDIAKQLEFVSHSLGRGRIVIVITDDKPLSDSAVRLIRQLRSRHEVLWMTIGDADLMNEALAAVGMRDVDSSTSLPEFVRLDPSLREEFAESVRSAERKARAQFDSLGIARQRITAESDVVSGFFRLMDKHKHARR